MLIDVYDFDGTIYDGDSTVDFVRCCLRRHPGMLAALPRVAAAALSLAAHRIGLTQFKTVLFGEMARRFSLEQEAARFWQDMKTRDDALRFAEVMNETAGKLRPHGLKLGYHNHAHEFVVDGGEVLMETVLNNVEPDVFAEFDVFWVAYAGYDPIRYIRKYAGRQPLMHLKELGPDRKANVECGAGVLDFEAIIALGQKIGTEHFIVEQEEYTLPPLDSCKVSLDNLLKL